MGPAPPAPADLALVLGLGPDDVLTAPVPPLALSCGTPFLCVPLRSKEAVARAKINPQKWDATLPDDWSKVFFFAVVPGGLHARMFAPGAGVPEDPATGSAACTVTEWLVRHHGLREGTGAWTVDQGVEIGRPSRIDLEADVAGGRIAAVRCGGTAVIISEGRIRA